MLHLNRRIFLACMLSSLAACTSTPKAHAPQGAFFSGRLSLRMDTKALSAQFELQGSAHSGRLSLSSPWGLALAQATWSPAQAQLRSDNSEQTFANLDDLTQEMVGQSLPVAALFDWLQGKPWSTAPSVATATGFEQLGWTIDTSRIEQGHLMAQRLTLPPMVVKVKLGL
jgi:outer membrane lipoprotein LolB